MSDHNILETLSDLSDIGVDIHITDYNNIIFYDSALETNQNKVLQHKLAAYGADVAEREAVSGTFKHYIPPHFRPQPQQNNIGIYRKPQQLQKQEPTKNTSGQKPYQRLIKNQTLSATAINPIEVKRPIDDKLTEVRALCEKLNTVQEIIDAVHNYDSDTEWQKLASATVFFDGQHDADILMIGDMPSKEDELNGIPLSGIADKILQQVIKYTSNDQLPGVAKANLLFWRSINQNAHSHYYDLCIPFIQRLITVMEPKKILLFGALTTGHLTEAKGTMMSLRGTVQNIKIAPHSYSAFVTFHPHYLLRVPIAKKFFWLDLLKFFSES